MKTLASLILTMAAASCTTLLTQPASAQPNAPAALKQQAAVKLKNPVLSMMLATARAGSRIVAVGDRGVILLSDDDGQTFRQASAVPSRATLTGVCFIDAKNGWAAGHWGVILHTQDGGESWQLQRDELQVDQPLHTIWFADAQHGIAAGLFSLLLRTEDGGKTWKNVALPAAPGGKRSDLNLFRLFPDRQGKVLMVGEQGSVYRSADQGQNWELLATGNKGTLWVGIVLADDSILVGGISGKILRSSDQGKSWTPVSSGTKSSITDFIELADGQIQGVALDGYSLASSDHGASFKAIQRDDQLPLTTLVANNKGKPVLFSQAGIVPAK